MANFKIMFETYTPEDNLPVLHGYLAGLKNVQEVSLDVYEKETTAVTFSLLVNGSPIDTLKILEDHFFSGARPESAPEEVSWEYSAISISEYSPDMAVGDMFNIMNFILRLNCRLKNYIMEVDNARILDTQSVDQDLRRISKHLNMSEPESDVYKTGDKKWLH